MPDKKNKQQPPAMPSAEEVQRELARVENIDDLFGKDGVFAWLSCHHVQHDAHCPCLVVRSLW